MMKAILILAIAAAFLISCREDSFAPGQNKKTINLTLKGLVNIGSDALSGRLSAGADPAYYFIEVNQGSSVYASGVFSNLNEPLSLSLPDNTNFTVNVKAVKKGWSFGVKRVVENGRTTVNWAELTNTMNYQQPMQNGSDAGLSWVYTRPDSTENNFQAYPQTDTYFAQFAFNSGTVQQSTVLELKRQIFGIETRLHHFRKGSVRVVLAQGIYSPGDAGTSKQVIQFPDSSKLDIFSRGWLPSDSDMIHLMVIYNDGATDEVIYDGYNDFARLEKKIIDVDLARFNSTGGRTFGFQLIPETLKPGETILLK